MLVWPTSICRSLPSVTYKNTELRVEKVLPQTGIEVGARY